MLNLRPEAKALLLRWVEPTLWALATLWLAWRTASAIPSQSWVGIVVAGTMTLIAAAGLRNALLRRRALQERRGPGIVIVDEGRISYLGPLGGGTMALEEISRIEVYDETWLFTGRDGTLLPISSGSEGVAPLADALAALPSFDVALLRPKSVKRQEIWTRPGEDPPNPTVPLAPPSTWN